MGGRRSAHSLVHRVGQDTHKYSRRITERDDSQRGSILAFGADNLHGVSAVTTATRPGITSRRQVKHE